ncbi:MAG: hypothetical protein LC732_00255, partial [Acidobacteria bacterium]|nr:hypothetical protein [Acidobacteriota bacterium]
SGSSNDTSAAIAEGTGWRLVWSPYPYTDLFHGWSPNGSVSAVSERWGVGRTPEREWDAILVDAPRPVAFFLRESTLTAGSPRVFGEVLGDADGPFTPRVTLDVARIGDGKVRLSWSAEPGDAVRYFNILRLLGTQWQTAIYGVAANHRSFEHDFGAARSFKVIAETSYGPVESNVATLEAARRRAVGR